MRESSTLNKTQSEREPKAPSLVGVLFVGLAGILLLFGLGLVGASADPRFEAFVDVTWPDAEDLDGDAHFRTLAAALAAPLGEYATVWVEPGRYEGDLVIAIEGLTLRSTRGPAQTVIAGQVRVEARSVRIEGFSIEGPPDRPAVVIAPQGGGAALVNNRVYGADVGVRVEEAGDVTFKGNQIYNHARDGVVIQGAWL